MGFKVNFTKKEMNEGYTIEQLKETQILQDYDKLKLDFEKFNFKY